MTGENNGPTCHPNAVRSYTSMDDTAATARIRDLEAHVTILANTVVDREKQIERLNADLDIVRRREFDAIDRASRAERKLQSINFLTGSDGYEQFGIALLDEIRKVLNSDE